MNRMRIAHPVPQQRKNAHASPPPKRWKPPEQPPSYQPISPTSGVPKPTRHMALALLFHARQPHLRQRAYGRGYTTKMVLSRITDTVEMHRNIHCHVMIGKRLGGEQQATHRAMQALIAVVDFRKTFDTMDSSILAKRPQSFPGTRLKHWLGNFLAHRYAQAKLGNPLGKQYALRTGGPKPPFLHHNHPSCEPLLSQSCR
ncbi:hypothetical protein Q4I28_003898 [Leishmania naiffi]|uniref:Reverse transcriptase domain-containing protein n=1 Tax=Leishmania naiffi TaxID=5678 RepID=A0AAW3BUA4_9TRYP